MLINNRKMPRRIILIFMFPCTYILIRKIDCFAACVKRKNVQNLTKAPIRTERKPGTHSCVIPSGFPVYRKKVGFFGAGAWLRVMKKGAVFKAAP
ncbi:MAG: hypothetical protein DRP86_08440 [Candidatus Neomarinimicrobiota bacterium]|nr:MAG: hypothetical protein DRP86_08440 [Candidatus Neomarinimicrobiota bacterium]